MMMTLRSGHGRNAKDIVMAGEDCHRPGEASWSVDEIRYDEIERDRIKEDTQLLYLVTSASFIEIMSDLYTRNPGAAVQRSDYDSYRAGVRQIAKHHFPREMAVNMMLKPLGLGAMAWRVAEPMAMSLCRLILG